MPERADMEPIWECGGCGARTAVRHWTQREGVMVHDPDAAFREAAGLDPEEPLPPGSVAASLPLSRPAASCGICGKPLNATGTAECYEAHHG